MGADYCPAIGSARTRWSANNITALQPVSNKDSPTDKPLTEIVRHPNPRMGDLPDDLTDLPADIQNYMRKLAEIDIFLTGKIL